MIEAASVARVHIFRACLLLRLQIKARKPSSATKKAHTKFYYLVFKRWQVTCPGGSGGAVRGHVVRGSLVDLNKSEK